MLELAPDSTSGRSIETAGSQVNPTFLEENQMQPRPVERFRAGLPLNAPDSSTFYGGDERGYTDYRTFDLASRGDAAA
jgi:hypothetical protein